MVDLLSLHDLTGLKLPEMSENDWQVFARCSLPAALQHQMWPVDESLDPSAQADERARAWKAHHSGNALQLIQDWSFIDKQEGLHQHMMKQLDGSAMGTEQYIKHVLES